MTRYFESYENNTILKSSSISARASIANGAAIFFFPFFLALFVSWSHLSGLKNRDLNKDEKRKEVEEEAAAIKPMAKHPTPIRGIMIPVEVGRESYIDASIISIIVVKVHEL